MSQTGDGFFREGLGFSRKCHGFSKKRDCFFLQKLLTIGASSLIIIIAKKLIKLN
jgi:hypothetical protein